MKFLISEREYNEIGTQKCFIDTDAYGHAHYIPRSQVKIINTKDVSTPYYSDNELTIEIPDWIIRKNDIPVFKLTHLFVLR